ncbi:MAG: DoxX family protein [Nocardioides sp.]|nr:DoxX family protein [Nocardioides sp.]
MTLPLSAKLLTVGFVASGTVHLVRPATFEPIMPRWLPRHREVIWASGVAELACAAGMAHPRTRRVAGYASAALLVGVFPAHVQMAQDAVKTDNSRFRMVAFGRMPLQVPMIVAALRAARSSRP